MSLQLESNENLVQLSPLMSPELLASAALAIQTIMDKKQDTDEYLREAIRQHERRVIQLEEELTQHRKKIQQLLSQSGEGTSQCEKEVDQYIDEEVNRYRKKVSQYREKIEHGSQLRDQAEKRGLSFQDMYPSAPTGARLQQPVKALRRAAPPPTNQKRSQGITLCEVMGNLLQRLYQLLLSLRRWLRVRPPVAQLGKTKERVLQQSKLFSASTTSKLRFKEEFAPMQPKCRAAGT